MDVHCFFYGSSFFTFTAREEIGNKKPFKKLSHFRRGRISKGTVYGISRQFFSGVC